MADYEVIIRERDGAVTKRIRVFEIPLTKEGEDALRPILARRPVSDSDRPIPSPPGPVEDYHRYGFTPDWYIGREGAD